MIGKERNYNMKTDDMISVEEKIDNGLLDISTNFLIGEINEDTASKIIRWIIFENTNNKNTPITIYINSDGGSLQDAFAIIEVMKKSKRDIRTIGIGSVASAAFLVFASGTKGMRFMAETTSIMSHQFAGDISGKYHEQKAMVREIEMCNQRMIDLLKECTDLDTRTIKSKLLPPSDVWFKVDELIELGVVDAIF